MEALFGFVLFGHQVPISLRADSETEKVLFIYLYRGIKKTFPVSESGWKCSLHYLKG